MIRENITALHVWCNKKCLNIITRNVLFALQIAAELYIYFGKILEYHQGASRPLIYVTCQTSPAMYYVKSYIPSFIRKHGSFLTVIESDSLINTLCCTIIG